MQGSLPSDSRGTGSDSTRPRTRSSSSNSSFNSSSELETEFQLYNRIISTARSSVVALPSLSSVPSLPSLSPIASSESSNSNSSPSSSSNSESEVKMSSVGGSGSNNNLPGAGGNNNPPPAQAMPIPFYFPVQIPIFKADKSQNVEIFLQQYEGMAAQGRFTPEMKAVCFINYLGGDLVLGFWDSLTPEEKADYDEIRTAFLAQFRKVKPDPAESFAKLNNRKLKWYPENIKKSEKVSDYFYDIKQLAMHCVGLRPDELVRIAYSNLHKDFRKELKLASTVGITIVTFHTGTVPTPVQGTGNPP
jgi:hypothetical protein